ncbi:ATP-binding protein [Flavihumibacter sp. UBA7668]|uniref:ATP-binding protein n=1 Tax=Flavihumibacter sp. UBA7668 TaxID=1946542 RepID=UPI0025BE5B0F|nr:AAA family ATPase [Flavihumibacter sp. UBA7668]
MEIQRIAENLLEKQIGKQKVLLLYGSRRVGKTTLIEKIVANHKGHVLFLQGEDMDVASLLQKRTVTNYKRLIGKKKLVVIDEAQAVPEIGKILKLMIDSIKGITIIATGSSSLELVSASGEPLVGRQLIFQLFPVAQAELSDEEDLIATKSNLEQRLIFGSYPELWQLPDDEEKAAYLKSMVSSYLLKDLLAYENVKGANLVYKLLQLLAFQVGSEVSTVELGNTLQINKKTVERYLDLLAKVFIIYPLSGFAGNLRKEVSKSKKWYFYDNGIRNALINNFSPLAARNDVGKLWEQYFLAERLKYNQYRQYFPQYHFWRTYDQQELDLLEINDKQEMTAYECKWKPNRTKIPAGFAKAYPDADFSVISPDNYLDFIV